MILWPLPAMALVRRLRIAKLESLVKAARTVGLDPLPCAPGEGVLKLDEPSLRPRGPDAADADAPAAVGGSSVPHMAQSGEVPRLT